MPWVLSAGWDGEGPFLLIKDRGRRILRPRATFPLYLALEGPVRDLDQAPCLASSRVEEWLAPPWYERRVEVHVLELEHPACARRILEALGPRATRWNDVLSPTQFLLLSLGLTCCQEVDHHLRPRGGDDLPPFSWVRIAFLDDFGETPRPEASRSRRALLLPAGEVVDVMDIPDEMGDPDLVLYSGGGLEYMRRLGILGKVLSGHRIPVRVDGTVLRREGLPGLVEWARLGRLPLDAVSNARGIGDVLTSMEAEVALRRRMLHRRGWGRAEAPRRLDQLLRADRAGHILTPEPGVLFGVHQLDFSSLYPSIIVKYNISPETVNNPFREARLTVPEVGHRISAEGGIVPEAVSEVLERRLGLRALRDAASGGEREILDARQSALKWVLVASFGYLGYRRAPFGSIEAYECVTALARGALIAAIGVAREMGFRVVHALVDGLWVLGGDPGPLAEAVTRATGIEMRVEGTYSWIAFLPGEDGAGVPNRYVGFRDGSLVAKGVMASRRDTPPIVAEAQISSLRAIGDARNPEDILGARDRAMEPFRRAAERILSGDVEPRELLIRRKLGRRIGEYTHLQPHVRAALLSGAEGYVEYVLGSRPYPRELGFRGYSRRAYLELLDRARREVEFVFDTVKIYYERGKYWDHVGGKQHQDPPGGGWGGHTPRHGGLLLLRVQER